MKLLSCFESEGIPRMLYGPDVKLFRESATTLFAMIVPKLPAIMHYAKTLYKIVHKSP